MIVPKTTNLALCDQPLSIVLVCALACEAKPLIDFFKLKKITSVHAFSLYKAGSVQLIVSGIGQTNMSAAVNWLCAYADSNNPQFWLNLGVAGHQSATIGSLYCIHKVSHGHSAFYPTKWLKHKLPLEQLMTINHEETRYKDNALYDMEGFAFYQAATRFHQQESVQCLKVVSDNQQHAITKDKSFVSNLIANNMSDIVSFIALHTSALSTLLDEPLFGHFQQQIREQWHFSHSQQQQLAKLCQAAQSHDIDFHQLKLTDLKSTKDVLARLIRELDNKAIKI